MKKAVASASTSLNDPLGARVQRGGIRVYDVKGQDTEKTSPREAS